MDVHAHRHPRDRDVGDARLERRRDDAELAEHALELAVLPAAQPAAEQEAVASARPGDVGDAIALGIVGGPRGLAEACVGRSVERLAAGVAQAQTELAVGADGHRARFGRGLARQVRHAHDGELEALGGVDRHQRDRVLGASRRSVRLAQVALVAEPHLVDEAREIGAAIALVGAGRAQQLAYVAEAALAVGRGQAGQLVVVLGDDALEQRRQPQLAAGAHEAVVELLEALHERAIGLGEPFQLSQLDRPVERRLRSRPQRGQPVVGDADERRGEHHEQRVVVEAVAQQREIGAQVAHLLRAVEAAAELAVRRQADVLERGGIRGCVARGAQQDRDVARCDAAAVDELAQAAGERDRLELARRARAHRPLGAGHEVQLDRRLVDRPDRPQRVRRIEVALVEALAEDVPDDRQQLGPRAVAPRQRQARCGTLAPRAEELDVGVAEAVDGLARVADEDALGIRPRERVEQAALQAVRVLELVHEHEVEALAHGRADRLALEQLARALLEVVEVERLLGLLARAVGLAVALEQGCDREPDLVLEARARLLLCDGEQVAHGPRGLALRRDEREQLAIGRRAGEHRLDAHQAPQVARRLRPRVARDGRDGRLGRGAQRREQLRPGMRRRQPRRERPGGAQARIEAADQRARAGHAVLAEQVEQHGRPVAALARDGVCERRLREHERLGLVEHAQLGREAGLGGVLAQQSRGQRVDRADLRARGVHARGQRALEPHRELARGGVGVGHDEHALGRRARLERRAHALDHERRLARPRAGRDDDLAARLDRRDLLLAESQDGAHGCATRQTPCQRHHGGHSPSGGSCSTSPTFMRPANSPARSAASSSSCSNSSGST